MISHYCCSSPMHSVSSIVLLLLMVGHVTAQESNFKPGINLTAPVKKELVVESQYSFSVARYDPAVQLKPLASREQASYATPEQAILAHFSSMYAKDYEWFQSTWSDESRRLNDADDVARNRTPEYWINRWEEALTGTRVELTHKITSGDYVLIAYRLLSTSGSAAPFEDTIVFVNQNNRWVLTQELASDPVLTLWNSTSLRVKRVIR